jgi:hypothetical protein
MAQDVALVTWDFNALVPLAHYPAVPLDVQLAASTTFAKGQLIAELTGTPGTYTLYDGTVAAIPGAPTVTGTGSTSAFGAGTHLVSVTGVNAQGETTPTAPVNVTLTATQFIHVAAISGLDSSFTKLNVYDYGVLIGSTTVTTGTSAAASFDATGITTKQVMPSVNTAYTIPNGGGCQTPAGFLQRTCITDSNGNIFYGTATASEWGQSFNSTPAWVKGMFNVADTTGLTALAVAQLGGRYLKNNTLVVF